MCIRDSYKAAKKAGIKPIIGCEVYVATRTRFDKVNKIDGKDVYKRQVYRNYAVAATLTSNLAIMGI